MKENTKNGVSRREFLGYSALGLASLTILPSWAQNGVRIAPSDRVVLGFIGLGQQALNDFAGFAACPGVQVAACCDVDNMKTERFKRRVAAWQASKGMNERCDKYEFYEDLLDRKDIDAVEVCTPDHWHALNTIHACQAGKDVYCQKPLAYTIAEGLAMVRAVRGNKRVLQVGSQQRSSAEFQKAIELVQNGAIGHVEKIYARVGAPPKPLDLAEEKVPANLNFNMWMGPLNDPKIHYHPDLCPPISLDPVQNEKLWGAWRWYQETGNGYTADWGAHMFDIAQAALGMDGSGPVEYIPQGYNGTEWATMKYANGVVMTEQPFLDDNDGAQGIKFIGSNGWIEVARGYLACSDPSKVPAEVAGKRPASREEMMKMYEEYKKRMEEEAKKAKKGGKNNQAQAPVAFETSAPHMQNFIDCVRSRQNPIAPVEVGASTNTLCCLANISRELNRPVKWDPATLSFVNDKEAANHRLYAYEYRRPYSLPCSCK
ncbi:Gfo/Idh/MocA family oxidoreductase [Parabacteroides sp. PF5-9]|uniref:Gfo/Idh/MocA family protein n=1 Tax=Parabacteroides sp. PF5-9 TaxID=1742404 RepID=UPI002476FBC7|nr:Gfo/Idh/MocA family oxidoreductase [Parabacteroides sp. PF5-9]MDH6358227.1 putative dehydrogenase [Parabacteroides sp. PF5-9]